MLKQIVAAALAPSLAAVNSGFAKTPNADDFQSRVDSARNDAQLVALGAVVVDKDGEVLNLAVSGERKKGSGDLVQRGDAWHIGSNTKMLTALLYARLVEQGHAHWQASLPELLPDLAAKMHPAWRSTTIEDLLSHRSGLQSNPGLGFLVSGKLDKRPLAEQRTDIVRRALRKAPEGKSGKYKYSNYGYLVGGAAIDRIANNIAHKKPGDGYATLFNSVLLENQNEKQNWGFGAPQNGIEGHKKNLWGRTKAVGKGPGSDNPAVMGPAGAAHVPLADHGVFISQFLKPEALHQKLLTPQPNAKSNYAFGWVVHEHEQYGRTYAHDGSNTMWYSLVRLVPSLGIVVIVNTNQMNESTVIACDRLVASIIRDREVAGAF